MAKSNGLKRFDDYRKSVKKTLTERERIKKAARKQAKLLIELRLETEKMKKILAQYKGNKEPGISGTIVDPFSTFETVKAVPFVVHKKKILKGYRK